jgi:hypothetical protein
MSTKPLQRHADWPRRLADFLASRYRTPFAWGTHDCCQTARAGVRAITGRDLGRGLGLRRYRTALGAAKQLARLGGIEAIPARAGLEEIPITYAKRGDVVLGPVGTTRELALGIVIGDKAAFAGTEGLDYLAVLECRRAWRV